jgi:hypothetical protein
MEVMGMGILNVSPIFAKFRFRNFVRWINKQRLTRIIGKLTARTAIKIAILSIEIPSVG